MDFKKMYDMQKALDAHIEANHALENEDLFDEKVLALLVEVGELANETRCFKFWSKKPSSPRDVILEEFVDGIHFILSLGIICGFTEGIQDISASGKTATGQFIDVFTLISKFQESRSEADFTGLFQSYLQLAEILGFSKTDIEEAYIRKNEVNYERQKNGY